MISASVLFDTADGESIYDAAVVGKALAEFAYLMLQKPPAGGAH